MKEYTVILPGGIVKKGFTPSAYQKYIPDYVAQFPDIANENDFNKVARRLENANSVNEAHIGFAGITTWEYACFQQLIKIASETQLEQLMKSENPVVRVYAYDAMGYKSPLNQKRWQIKLKNDTAQFRYMAGCMCADFTVAGYVGMAR